MIDAELITRKMVLITDDLRRVAALATRSLAEYLASPTDELAAERLLERAIGRMVDINYHLVTESGLPPPRDYYDSFLQLAGLGVLSPEFARTIAACAGLRNRIAHEYDEIDPCRIHAALGDALRDIPLYLDHVNAHIRRLPA